MRRLSLLPLLLLPLLAVAGEDPWVELEPGLEMAQFDSQTRVPLDGGDLTVLRVDPTRWRLLVLGPDRRETPRSLSPGRWSRRHDLVAVINAGMYQGDGSTHVGYCQVDGVVANAAANGYRSALALDPVAGDDPAFRLFDLDETPLAEVAARYATVLQNLRLIKRPGENRWQPSDKRWTEAALGEDARGRALLIHCALPRSMHELNEILLALPLDLAAAQHLDGNTAARLWVDHPRAAGQWHQARGGDGGSAVPNVLGVQRRLPTRRDADD